MAICPFAAWKPLPANTKQVRMVPRVAILHTAVDAPGDTDLYGWFKQSGLESHFFVHNDGRVTQYMDTAVIAEANYRANSFAVSIETEDDGNPRATPWSPVMLKTIIKLLDWLCTTHNIPRRQCDRWDGSGIGWHSMWGINTRAQPNLNWWTTAIGKDCPGAPRIRQMTSLVLPALSVAATPTISASEEDTVITRYVKDRAKPAIYCMDFSAAAVRWRGPVDPAEWAAVQGGVTLAEISADHLAVLIKYGQKA